MASGATSIDALPSSDKPNVTLETQEMPVQASSIQQPSNTLQQSSLSNEDINKIISGIQTASQSNLTALPSRDIPMNTVNEVTDKQIQPNYVPKDSNDYIRDHDTGDVIYEKQMAKQRSMQKQDDIYDKLQTPVMISILFLLFQLPVFNKNLFKYVPSLFIKDGTLSFGGHVFKSCAFGVVYFLIMKGIDYMSDI